MTAPAYLGTLWPLWVLGKAGEAACQGKTMAELLTPATPAGLRQMYRPVLADTNPTAAAGLDATPDAELAYWCQVLRVAPLGSDDFMPAFLFHEGDVLRGLAAVCRLPLFERQDVFLAAMHQRGLS